MLVTVQLLVVGIGDGFETPLVFRRENGLRIAPEIGAGHGDDMHLVAGDELRELAAQAVVGIAADVMELVDRDQPTVEGFDTQFIDGKAKSGVRANQHLVVACEELADCLHLGLSDARLIDAGSVAEVPLRLDGPVRPKALGTEFLVGEAAADGAFGHHDDGLLEPLVVQLVERNEHESARRTGGGRRFQ